MKEQNTFTLSMEKIRHNIPSNIPVLLSSRIHKMNVSFESTVPEQSQVLKSLDTIYFQNCSYYTKKLSGYMCIILVLFSHAFAWKQIVSIRIQTVVYDIMTSFWYFNLQCFHVIISFSGKMLNVTAIYILPSAKCTCQNYNWYLEKNRDSTFSLTIFRF